jgi:hypothetical protein
MAKMEYSAPQVTNPAWAGDFLDRHSLMPGGATVNPADFPVDSKGRKPIRSGVLLGRTYTERDSGTGFGPAALADEEVYLLAFDVPDAVQSPECELYRHQSLVRENLLPDWGTMATGFKTLIRNLYQCTKGY